MLIIDYKSSFKALNLYIDNYNNTKYKHGDKIKSSVAHTAKEIVRIYGAFLLKASSIDDFKNNELPPLRTNNIQLSKLTKASSRTIQRHIKKLMTAEIITDKKFRGSNSGYDLWITSKILLNNLFNTLEINKNEVKKDLLEDSENKGFTNNKKPKCPDTYTGYNSYTNNLLIVVDNINKSNPDRVKLNIKKRSSLTLTNCLNKTGNVLTGYTGEQEEIVFHNNAGEQVEKKRAEKNGDTSCAARISARHLSQIEFYVNFLWMTARNVLYKGIFLTERQQTRAIELLFRWYLPVSENNLSKIHKRYVDRIFLVKKFIDKDPENRYVQLPNRYFDPDNPNGFTGSKKWYQLHLKRQEELRGKFILYAQIRKFTNNEKKDTDKRRPSLEVYRECEQRIGKLKDHELLQQFYAAILQPEINNQLYINQQSINYA